MLISIINFLIPVKFAAVEIVVFAAANFKVKFVIWDHQDGDHGIRLIPVTMTT